MMEGKNGVLDTLDAEQAVIDTGTTPADLDVHYQEVCQERGAGYVDGGLTRHGSGESDIKDETVYTMFVGGGPADYQRARSVIDTLSHEHEFFEVLEMAMSSKQVWPCERHVELRLLQKYRVLFEQYH